MAAEGPEAPASPTRGGTEGSEGGLGAEVEAGERRPSAELTVAVNGRTGWKPPERWLGRHPVVGPPHSVQRSLSRSEQTRQECDALPVPRTSEPGCC